MPLKLFRQTRSSNPIKSNPALTEHEQFKVIQANAQVQGETELLNEARNNNITGVHNTVNAAQFGATIPAVCQQPGTGSDSAPESPKRADSVSSGLSTSTVPSSEDDSKTIINTVPISGSTSPVSISTRSSDTGSTTDTASEAAEHNQSARSVLPSQHSAVNTTTPAAEYSGARSISEYSGGLRRFDAVAGVSAAYTPRLNQIVEERRTSTPNDSFEDINNLDIHFGANIPNSVGLGELLFTDSDEQSVGSNGTHGLDISGVVAQAHVLIHQPGEDEIEQPRAEETETSYNAETDLLDFSETYDGIVLPKDYTSFSLRQLVAQIEVELTKSDIQESNVIPLLHELDDEVAHYKPGDL